MTGNKYCQVSFSCASKVVKKGSEILMTGKAYNNRVITEWLAWVLPDVARANPGDEMLQYIHLAMSLISKLAWLQRIVLDYQ